MKRRLLTLALVFAFVLTMLAGCGSTTSTSTSTSTDTSTSTATKSTISKSGLPIVEDGSDATLSVLVVSTYPDVDPADIVILQELKEQTNVNIEYEVIANTAWAEMKGLVLSRSELPDIMLGKGMFTDTDMMNMASEGQILALDEYLDYAENFSAVLAADESILPTITAEDGHFYAFPNYITEQVSEEADFNPNTTTNRISYINQTWLDNLGLDMPTTTEEFAEVLLAFKNDDPNGNGMADEIPITGHEGTSYLDDFFGAFGLVPHNNSSNLKNIGIKDGKVVFSPFEQEYRNAIDFYSNLWSEGAVDPELFTQDASMFNAKLKSETRTVGVFTAWRGTAWRLSNEDTEYTVLPPLSSEGDNGLYQKMTLGVSHRCSVVVTKDCENPELAVRWIDNMFEDDNAYQLWVGSKIGYTLELNDNNQFDIIKAVDVSDPEYQLQIGNGYGIQMITLENSLRRAPDPDPLSVLTEKADTDVFFADYYPAEIYPNVFLTADESAVVSKLGPDIEMYVEQCYAQWITSGCSDSDWEAFEKQLTAMGIEEYLAQYQSAYDRFMANA